MKKTIKVLGIIALAAVIGFSVVSCDDGGGGANPGGNPGGNNPPGGNPPSGGNGTFTVTGIPSKFNGQYALFWGYREGYSTMIYGCQSIMGEDNRFFSRISNGSVTLNMYVFSTSIYDWDRYSGNDTMTGCMLGIYESATDDNDALAACMWDPITFSNGSASRNCNSGQFIDFSNYY